MGVADTFGESSAGKEETTIGADDASSAYENIGDFMRCDTCKWWQRLDTPVMSHPDDLEGSCHRFPPVQNLAAAIEEAEEAKETTNDTTNVPRSVWIWVFPFTDGATFCGEWKAAE
jgi:hypothetical protein